MSEYRDILELVHKQYKPDAIGNQKARETKTTVFCAVKSIRQSEFYAAATHDLQPEIMFVIRQFEYDGQTAIDFNGKRYEVMRTYAKGHEALELICRRVLANVKQGIR